jgi:hypothetical protein
MQLHELMDSLRPEEVENLGGEILLEGVCSAVPNARSLHVSPELAGESTRGPASSDLMRTKALKRFFRGGRGP